MVKQAAVSATQGRVVCTLRGNLPPPLLPEEEQEWIVRLSAGDELAPHLLIERNLRLVVYIARKFENTAYVLRILYP